MVRVEGPLEVRGTAGTQPEYPALELWIVSPRLTERATRGRQHGDNCRPAVHSEHPSENPHDHFLATRHAALFPFISGIISIIPASLSL